MSHRLEEEIEEKSVSKGAYWYFEKFCLFIGALSGMIAISMVIFNGGKAFQRLDALDVQLIEHANRLKDIEKEGSGGLKTYMAVDTVQNALRDDRLSRVETACRTLQEINVELGKMNAKMDALKESLEEHKRVPK
jgi:hypothetical protein